MDPKFVWEVIEINPMGDHTVIGRYRDKEKAETVMLHLRHYCEEPCTSYYVNDIREEYNDE